MRSPKGYSKANSASLAAADGGVYAPMMYQPTLNLCLPLCCAPGHTLSDLSYNNLARLPEDAFDGLSSVVFV